VTEHRDVEGRDAEFLPHLAEDAVAISSIDPNA
jgi:hypothetical protein